MAFHCRKFGLLLVILLMAPLCRASPGPAYRVLELDFHAMQSNALSTEDTGSRTSTDWIIDEAGVVLLSGLAAIEPEAAGILLLLAAPFNYLAMEGDPKASQGERVLVAFTTVSLALYNYSVDEAENSEEDIFLVNFVVWNLMLFATNLHEVEYAAEGTTAGSTFSIQTDTDKNPYLFWNYRFH